MRSDAFQEDTIDAPVLITCTHCAESELEAPFFSPNTICSAIIGTIQAD